MINQHSLIRWRLLLMANRAAIRSSEDAAGKCFYLTMNFAFGCINIAELEVIRWKVSNDRKYCEHWSVGISDQEVIDLTRVQVDGKTTTLHHIDSYPKNYKNMKRYPVFMMLQACQNLRKYPYTTAPNCEAMTIRWAMFRYDLSRAPFGAKPNIFFQEILDIGYFAWWLFVRKVMHKLEMRRDLLITRLHY